MPIPDVLIPVLREHLANLAEEATYSKWRPNIWLFPSTVGTLINNRNLIRGVHRRIVMEVLRHAQISTTMNIYAHALPQVNRDALNSLGDLAKPQTMNIARRVKKDDEKG